MARVARLVILLTLPARVSETHGDAWLRDAVALLSAHRDVERAEISSLAPGSRRHARNWDRLIELHLTDGAGASGWADTGPCGEWLADLRSLRLQPVVMLADTAPAMREDRA
jgi:hypothetical protein